MNHKKENLLPLKVLVISLGLVLAGGFVFVVAVVLGKLGPGASGCPPREVAVAGMVEKTEAGKGVWHLNVRGPEGLKLITVDACSGRTVSTLIVKR